MPWEETMDQRVRAVLDVLENGFSKASVCEDFGVSRPTLDKWLHRYEREGARGLDDRSRAPHRHANMLDADTVEKIVAFRQAHPDRGPRKIKVELERKEPQRIWPASSTIAKVLDRHGLTVHRKRRRFTEPYTKPFVHCNAPNDVWCIDFKGWFCTGDAQRCNPLTLSDANTRFLFRCHHVADTGVVGVKPILVSAFREFGLPRAIRSDNGAPFASRAPLGLSKLSLWWNQLGIIHERIEPGKPQQNGRHERMHLTLKQCTASPPKPTLRAQQQAFMRFQDDYNYHRPHEALGQRPPGDYYRCSERAYPRRLSPIRYPPPYLVRRVEQTGVISWHGRRIFISEVFGGEPLGLLALDERYYRVYFDTLDVGIIDTQKHIYLHGKFAKKVLEQLKLLY